jgi:uncharacterized phage-associated protein
MPTLQEMLNSMQQRNAPPYDALSVANFMLGSAKSNNLGLSPMQVQKLVYFAHGWNLGLKDSRLIEQSVEAWEWGPVIREIYKAFKCYGSGAIGEEAKCPPIPATDTATTSLLNKVFEKYGSMSAWQLSRLSHLPGSPWEKTWEQNTTGIIIPDELIRTYFKDLSEKNKLAHA